MDAPWTLVVPVKRLDRAKSRLAATGERRQALALAFALDTTAAAASAAGVGLVVVVTSDAEVRAALAGAAGPADTGPGAAVRVVADGPGGLNEAVLAGAAHAPAGSPVAALPADLPALRGHELAGALGAAGRQPHPRAYVADAGGTGTTLLAARAGTALAPAYGPGSAAAHAAGGAVRLRVHQASGLRRDVDTAADLAAAVALGVGPATAAVLGVPPAGPGAGWTQATVRRWDAGAGPHGRPDGPPGGDVVLDDGRVAACPAHAAAGAGLRLLRPGQRVAVRLGGPAGAPEVLALRLGPPPGARPG